MKNRKVRMPIVVGGSVVMVALVSSGIAVLTTPLGDNLVNQELSDDTERKILDMVNFQDGSYYAETTYVVDVSGDIHTIGVNIVVKDQKIESMTVVELEDGVEIENKYLGEFETETNQIISGQRIEDVYDMQLVSGSTITSNAFKDAVRKIEQESLNVEISNSGEFTQVQEFLVPPTGETHIIKVTLKLDKDVIESANIVEIDENSDLVENKYMKEFNQKMQDLVIGKNIKDVSSMQLVSGSTLTSDAFKQAIAKI